MYKKSFSKRVRRYRRKPNRKAKPSKAIKSYVKRQIHKNIENKSVCLQVNADPVDDDYTSVGYDLLANMARGTSETVSTTNGVVNQGMLGLQVRLQKLVITYSIMGYNMGLAMPYSVSAITRLIVLFDKQASNNTSLELFNTASNFDNLVLQTNHITAPFQQGVKRYKILYNKIVKQTNAGQNIVTGKISINLKNTLLQYFPTISSFYELNKRLRFFVVGTNDQASTFAPTIQFFSRVTFEDA